MATTTTDPAADFCRAWTDATGISVQVYGDGPLSWKVVDVAEYPSSWGRRRPREVSRFVAGRKAVLYALRPDGTQREDGPGTEYLAKIEIPAAVTPAVPPGGPYQVCFRPTMMGNDVLGWCEREGRDRTEEMRRYCEYLERSGWAVTEVRGRRVSVERQ